MRRFYFDVIWPVKPLARNFGRAFMRFHKGWGVLNSLAAIGLFFYPELKARLQAFADLDVSRLWGLVPLGLLLGEALLRTNYEKFVELEEKHKTNVRELRAEKDKVMESYDQRIAVLEAERNQLQIEARQIQESAPGEQERHQIVERFRSLCSEKDLERFRQVVLAGEYERSKLTASPMPDTLEQALSFAEDNRLFLTRHHQKRRFIYVNPQFKNAMERYLFRSE